MKKLLFIIIVTVSGFCSRAQVTDSVGTITEQQLENITENNTDADIEDDSYLQELVQYKDHPINLNTADGTLLKNLNILTPLQVQSLLSYRNLLGSFINLYEIQAIPGWDITTINRLRPFITVNSNLSLRESLGQRFSGGDRTLLLRANQVVERSKGFKLDSTKAVNYYMGSPQRLLVRYKYTYKNLLQYGFTGEKDPGEQFFQGAQKNGFDFYSAHFFARNLGVIKAVALGDYTVNLGQGLTQWQSLAFKKGPDVLATKRQSAVLRPYSSPGEISFHRGAAVTLAKKKWETTLFGSLRNVDANFVTDTSVVNEDFISSLQTSGYHRTKSEVEDRNINRMLAFGGNLAYNTNNLHIGVNAIQYQLKYGLKKDAQAYNYFALTGKNFGNYSTDYSYTVKNMHFFGEAATSSSNKLAFVQGLLISAGSNVDMSFLYRNLAPGYQSLNTNAFTESSSPTNERGFFSGIHIKPSFQWQIDAYADVYRFPALKFRVNGPTTGTDYLVQLLYRPNKVFEAYTRYKRESKGINYNPDDLAISPVIYQPRQGWRTQVSYKVSPVITLRNRVEIVWFDKQATTAEQGFLVYGDVFYKPMRKKYAGNMRLLYFETDSYNSRLYAFENDVLYGYSIPVFYDKGYRYYLNLNYDITRKLTGWVKIAQTVYKEKQKIGSGLDEISGNKRTEIKVQVIYKF